MKKRKSRALTAIAVLVVLAVIAAAAMKLGLFERKTPCAMNLCRIGWMFSSLILMEPRAAA